ncbi:PREDICTED: zinc finger CCCH domain-containing protein 24 [Ipomoea nil]|uniref:zinc finger CCCH domain-containing protein 24 n=1 Tax=Ipomoea nil TaxID=35883 RepID=UPI000901AC8C|nr:PREDICTED: zinc finger CCCH domain-containing protein 24 [Ipomoea nil]
MSAASPPAETLNPAMIAPEDSSDQVPLPEALPQIEPDETKPSEKRKREEEPDPDSRQNPLWKTTLCSYFRRSDGSCSHGDSCRYAHGEAELRPRPDNSWDPTSERAKKMARKADEDVDTADVKEEKGNEVMMTEAFAEEEGFSSGSKLAKCFVNLPLKWSSDKLQNFLNEHGILFKAAKKKRGMVVGFVTFENAEQVKSAEELDGKEVGNKTLKVADVIPRSFEKQNKDEKQVLSGGSLDISGGANNIQLGENSMNSDSVVKGRSARSAVTPLADVPYADQLEDKKNSLMQTLKKLTRSARKACPSGVSLPEWIINSRDIGGLPCKLESVVASPLINGYRNKCEFSVGYSLKGKPCVGFLLGNFREGVTAVEEPVDCPNISRVACRYAAIFQEFLQHTSLPMWNRLNNTGFWRQLTVREGRTPGKTAEVENPESHISDVMLMVQICSVGLESQLVNTELHKMAKAFVHGASAELPVLPLTSLVVQDHTGISNVAPSDAPLRSLPILEEGSDYRTEAAGAIAEAKIHDYINGLQFCISPTAFFQVNTLAAEKLYSLAGEWAGLGPDTLLFDICCGTGTIGLTLSHRVGMVVGIEMNSSAVSDAQRNADINGIKNSRFICAKAEDVLGSVLKEYLVGPQIQDELSKPLKKSDLKITSLEEKVDSEDKTPGSEDQNGFDQESSKSAAELLENGNKDTEDQLHMRGESENTTTPVQKFNNVVAIVDPPRMGLHPTVIKVLRTHQQLRRLVYISCNPESLVANAIELCTPSAEKVVKDNNKNNRVWKNMSSAGLARHRTKSMPKSEPFKPVKATAVDLFPHTPHCELVMLLER